MKQKTPTIKSMAPERKHKPNQKLIDLRKTLGLDQYEMAAKLGVTHRTYQNYEGGLTIPEPVKILISLIKDGRY